jgi:hypothetical protein
VGESLVDPSAAEPSLPVDVSVCVDVSDPVDVSVVESVGVVTSASPPSSGILLRSKSTRSSQPGIAAMATHAAAATRLHLIERFVLIVVLA